MKWSSTSEFPQLLHQCSCLKLFFYYIFLISNLTFSSAVYNYSTFTLVSVFFFNFLLKFNSYNSICHFKVYTSGAFSTLTELCDHYFCLVLKYLLHPKGHLMSIKQYAPRPSSSNLWQALPSVFMALPVLDSSCKSSHKLCGHLHLAYFIYYNTLRVHPWGGIY